MEIVELKVNYLKNPLGFELQAPVFSWKTVSTKGKNQRNTHVRI
ncbi:MAG: hypothetical protein PHC91_04160 [Eubacteriales bacterium]|nr:hypothetical protein [Eubacteriales bacterium]